LTVRRDWGGDVGVVSPDWIGISHQLVEEYEETRPNNQGSAGVWRLELLGKVRSAGAIADLLFGSGLSALPRRMLLF
jgi:hypothetical protein